MIVIVSFLTLAVLAVTVASCVSDVRSTRIPNWHSVVVLAAFVPAFLLSPESFGPWWSHLGAFALMFAVTFGLFAAGIMGGGDTKLGSVLALWVGMKGLMVYLFYMALVGGVLGVLSIIFRKRKPFVNPIAGSWIAQVQAGENAVPYGVAISVGAWAAFFHTGFLHHQLDELFKIIH